jgi:chaperone LolA
MLQLSLQIPRPAFFQNVAALGLFAVIGMTTLLAATSARAADLSPAETAQLLGKLQDHRAKFPSLTADFTEEKTSHLLNKPVVGSGTLAFQAPNKFRRELRGTNPSLMVSNGQRLWIYYPNFKEAELYPLGQQKFFDQAIEALTAGLNFQNVAAFYRYTASRDDDGYRLVLTPRAGGIKRILTSITVSVDETYRIQKTVAVLPQGDEIVTTYRNQRPTPVPTSTFEYSPPAEAHVSQPFKK